MLELVEGIARRKVGDVRLGRDVVEIDGGAQAGDLQVEDVDHLREIGLAGVAVDQRREGDCVVDPVVDAPADEELREGEVGGDRREHLELRNVRLAIARPHTEENGPVGRVRSPAYRAVLGVVAMALLTRAADADDCGAGIEATAPADEGEATEAARGGEEDALAEASSAVDSRTEG